MTLIQIAMVLCCLPIWIFTIAAAFSMVEVSNKLPQAIRLCTGCLLLCLVAYLTGYTVVLISLGIVCAAQLLRWLVFVVLYRLAKR